MSVVCINTNLSSFRKLAQEMNVSTLTLHDALSIWWNIKEQTKEPTQEDLWAIISPKEVIVPNQAIMEQCELGDISNLIYILRNIIGDSKGVTIEKLQEELAVPITVEELQQAIPTLITWKDGNNVVHINVGDPVLSYDNELQSILDSAPRDEQGRLLAPNGKPSNLTERQYAQVRTKAFIDWFGDWINDPENASKVMDENGEPMVVYHYTPEKNLTEFNLSFTGKNWKESLFYGRNAAYFLSHPDPHYSKLSGGEYGKYEIPVFLNIKNPEQSQLVSSLRKKIVNKNIDGLIPQIYFENINDIPEVNRFTEGLKYLGTQPFVYGEFVVFNSNQIKSATDNIGTFSRESDNIYASRKDTTHRQGIQSIEDIFGKGLFEPGTTISIQDAVKALEKNKEIAPMVALLKHLQGAHPEIIIYRQDIVFDSSGREVDGLYDADNKKIIISNNSTKPVGQVLTHELLHPLLLDKLNANPEIRSELDRIRENAISVLGEESLKYYGLTSVEELISEVLTEGKLIKALDNIEGIKNTKAKGILQQIRDWFNKCLHLIFKKEPSLLDNALYEIELLISSNSEYTEQSFDIIERKIYSMRGYDASELESRLFEVQKNYPWLFKTDKVTPFIVRGNDGKYKVKSSYKGEYLLNNRKTANKKLRDLHKGEFSSTKDNYKYTKIDTAFRLRLLNIIEKSDFKDSDYTFSRNKKALIEMTNALFDFFEREGFRILITNNTLDGKGGSVVINLGKDAIIYYQEHELQGGKILNIIHELLHLATNQISPFEAEGRYISNDVLQGYYDMFCKKLQEDSEYKKWSSKALQSTSEEEFNSIPGKYRVLIHAASSPGEFLSSFISNIEVRQVTSTILYNDSIFDKIIDSIKEFFHSLFKGYSYLDSANIIDDITSFLLDNKYTGEYEGLYYTEEGKKELDAFNKMWEVASTINTNEKSSINWARTSENNYEVSSQEDEKFSAFEFYSGAAIGADTEWEKAAQSIGIKVKNYTVQDWNNLPTTWKDKLDSEYREVVGLLGRKILDAESYTGKLVRRDMMQADKADAIFAIGKIASNGYVDGGTGYATTRGILRGIPVYVFDQTDKQWKVWDTNTNKFIITSEPTLTPHAAVIGTRQLEESGKEAIKSIISNFISINNTDITIDEKPEITEPNIPKTNIQGEEVDQQITITPVGKFIPEYGNIYRVNVENLINELTLLDELKLDGTINLKDLILLPDITEKNIPLIAKLCASPYFNKSKQGVEIIELTDEALQKAAKRHSKILKYKKDKETGKVTITVPKSFIVGYTLEEIDMYYNHEALMNISSISPIKLKSFAKATMFLASDYVTRILEQDPDVIDELNLTEEELKKCTSRIDVLNTIGLGRILNHIKEQFFDNHAGDLIDACQEISNNWNAFVELGFLELMQLEKIALNQQEVFQESNIALDIFDTADEQEIQEIFGSSVETWLVGFRLMSVFSGLSQMIKQRLHSLILSKLDEDGDLVPVLNELGMFEAVDATMATASILKWTRYSTSLDLMIEKLKQHLNEALWLKPLILELEETEDEQFKASFFTNFCKYFQSYVINFVDKDGVSKSKTINENEYADTVIQNLKIAFEQNRSNLFITSKPEGIYTAGIDKLYNAINATTLQNLDIDKVVNWLQMGFNIPFTGEKEALLTLLKEGHNWENFKTHALSILKNTQSAKKPTEYNPLNSSNLSDYKGILSILEQVIPTNIESVSYSDGKLHYSYVIPSYLNILCGKISGHLQGLYTEAKNENERYLMFLQDEFGQYSWFKNRKTGKWLNHWLQRLATDSKARETFKHIAVLTKDKISYVDKNSAQYAASLIFQYFANGINSNKAYFRLPMMSNKPSEEYIQFFKTQVEEIPSILANTVFLQELERILGCKERANTILNPNSPNYHPECGIKAFDKNGLTFQFLEYLSVFLDSKQYKQTYDTLSEDIKPIYDSLKASLDRYFSGKQLTDDETLLMIKDVEKVIKYNMDIKLNNYIQSLIQNGLLVVDNGKYRITDPALQRMDIFQTSDQIEKYLKEYFYNDVFATMLILQLTVTDKAFYKDDDDLQKRLAQLHAPVMRGYVQVKDFSTGQRVSDETYRSIILKDDLIKSDILTNLHLARKLILSQISDPVIKQKTEMFLKDAISAFEEVNFADAQSFQTPTALRKKLHMFGKWTQEMEDAYNKIMSGAPYGEADVNVLWLPLKPFVYGMKLQNSYSSMGTIRSGVQFKNSEYTLILADAILRMANMPNKLQAIYDVLEATHHTKNADNTINMQERTTNGIDSCQFESTFKAGLTGIIDITEQGIANYINKKSDKVKEIKKQLLELNPWLANNEMLLDSYLKTEIVKHILQDAIYNASDKTLSGYNKDYVQELPFDCYGLQQEVPSHFRHEQQMGSQMRALIIADTPNLNPVTGEKNYVVIDGKRISVEEAKTKYMSTIVNNINISRQEIEEELNLTSKNQQLKDLALSRLLRKTILEDGRYGADALWGVTINPETGTFNRPLSDPTQLDMIEKMLNSIVKNRIHKQKIAGGPCVQVTNFGTSDELHIRYKAADTFNEDGSIAEAGKLLLTEQEFNALKGLKRINRENAEKVISQRVARHLDDYVWDDKIQTYKQYVETFLHSPAYYECYAPIYADWLRDKQFLDKNGNINIDKVAEANPKALQMIGYRIPTEAKYSMCPIKIVGFLPVTAGEGIMLPKELTTLSGSDKMRHCFYHYNIKNHINCWKL